MVDSRNLAGKWLVRTVRQNINLCETLICRSGARYSVSEGEGFSLLHARAATLLDEDRPFDAHSPMLPSTLVYHRERRPNDGVELHTAFELYASNAQEAIWHSLIAHQIASHLGHAGVCTIDASLADQYAGVHFPSQAMIDALKDDPAVVTEEELWPETILSIFDDFSKQFGIRCRAFEADALVENGICFVASGSMVSKAERLVRRLKRADVDASILKVSLISPFASREIGKVLETQKVILVLGEEPIAEQSALLVGVYDACTPDGKESRIPIHYLSPSSPRSFERLASILGIAPEIFTSPLERDAGACRIIGAAPSGDMSMGFLLDLASYLTFDGTKSAQAVTSPHNMVSTLAVCDNQTQPDHDKVDVLFLSHPGLLDIPDIVTSVARGGSILIQGRSVEDASFWPLLSDAQKAYVEREKISLYALAGDLTGEYQTMNIYGSFVVHGAILSLLDPRTLSALLERLAQNGVLTHPELERMRLGQVSVHVVDRTVSNFAAHDPYFAPQIQLPHMLGSDPTRINRAEWRAAIRNFYVKGPRSESLHHPLPGLSIRPAALNSYLEALEKRRDYPILATREHGNPTLNTRRLDTTLRETMGDLSTRPEAQATLNAFLDAAVTAADATLHISLAGDVLRDIASQTAKRPDADEGILSRIYAWIDELPPETHLIGLNRHTLLDLYVLSVRAARRSRMRDVRADIRLLITQLRDAIRLDEDNDRSEKDAHSIKTAFGDEADILFNTDFLTGRVKHQHNAHLSPNAARHARMIATLETLEAFMEDVAKSDDLILVYASHIDVKTTYDRVRIVKHDDPIAVAAGLFDAISQDRIEVFKAMRVARLDIANAFDEDFHTDILEHFTWQDLSEDELRLLPVIGIVESTASLYAQLTELSRLIRSNKPLDVLAIDPTSGAMMSQEGTPHASYNPGFSYLATAYRDACVAQASLARPEDLVQTLARMNRLLRPAVSVVTCPTWSWRLPAKVQLEAAHLGRVAPLFQYDPTLAESAASTRFSVSGNAQPDKIWPVCDVQYIDEDGSIQTMSTAFTFAHALALAPGYNQYFRILPNDAWNDELVEIDEFLAMPPTDKPRIPYIWGVVDSTLRKCIMTRDVANACRDRMQRWRTLVELAKLGTVVTEPNPITPRPATPDASNDADREALNASRTLLSRVETSLSRMVADIDALLTQKREAPQDDASMPDSDALDDPAGLEGVRDETTLIETLDGAGSPTAHPDKPADAPASPLPVPRLESQHCIGCGACVAINDNVFAFGDDSKAHIIKSDATIDDCREAAASCPVSCIIID